MTDIKIVLVAVLLLGVSSANAAAFERTEMGGGAPSASAAESDSSKGLPGLQLTVPGQSDPGGSSNDGIEVRLPMIGVIGKLPKLDFGLELLYGADKDQVPEEDRLLPEKQSEGDVTIRGSVKHRF